MTQAPCLAVSTLQLLLEEMGTEWSEELLGHLESCTLCQKSLETLAGDASTWRFTAVGLSQAQRYEPALLDVMTRLKDEDLGGIGLEAATELSFLHPTDEPGVLGLLGHYEVQEIIGRGGMGIVLKATDPALNRTVALKVLAPAHATDPGARRRFVREGRAAARVVHDHIVTVHGVQETDGLPFLIMQHVEGESLHDRIEREGPLEWIEAVRIARQAASGLAAAHAQGLIHRDIKPANLLLEVPRGPDSSLEERVRITDFGLARMAGDVQVTQHGMVIGTPEYMAPEQARGERVDHRADLFSLGSVIYAMCAGRSPFHGSTTLAVIRQVCDEMQVPVRSLNPEVPKWLAETVERLMQKNPAERFQQAAEVEALLAGFLTDGKEPRRVSPTASRAPQRRRPGLRWLVGLAAAVLLALVPLGIWFGGLTAKPGDAPAEKRAAAGADEKKNDPDADSKKERARADAADNKDEEAAGAKKLKQAQQPFTPPQFEAPKPEQARAIAILERLNAKFQFNGRDQVVHVAIPRGTEVDGILEDLLPLTEIANFSLQGTKITDAGMKYLAGFKGMHQLYLGQTAIADAGVKELANCEAIAFLGLENTQVTDAGLHALANLKNLRYLNVGGTAITDASLKDIGAFPQMGFLCLYSTRVSDAGLKELQGLTGMHTLLINDTDVTDAGLKKLAGLKLLKRIDAKNTAMTEAGLKTMKETMPGVKVEWEAAGSSGGGLGWLTAASCVAISIAVLAAVVNFFQR